MTDDRKLVLDATNLLGDSLYALRPVEMVKDRIAALIVGGGFAGELFEPLRGEFPVVRTMQEAVDEVTRMKIASPHFLKLSADVAAKWCLREKPFKHLTEGYGYLLGLTIGNDITPPQFWMTGQDDGYAHVGIAPFSRSCARHEGLPATKTIEDWKWRYVTGYIRKLGWPLRVYGAPDERLSYMKIAENEYFQPKSLQELEGSMRSCRLLVSIDNGLSHLASAYGTPTIVLWPKILPVEFIAPLWSPTTRIIQMNHNPDEVVMAAIMHGVRELTKELVYGIPIKKESPAAKKRSQS